MRCTLALLGILALSSAAIADEPPAAAASTEVKESPADRLTAEQTADREQSIRGSLSGIGAKLGEQNGWIVIEKTLPDGPAQRAEIADGSRIVAINDVKTNGLGVADAVKLIVGPEGTKVTLKIRPPRGRLQTIELVREKIVIGRPRHRMIDDQIGLIQLTVFNQETPAGVREAVSALQQEGAKGLILDLRGSPGGLLPAVANVADLFLPRGRPMWIFEDAEGNRQVKKSTIRQQFALPMVVLVDGETHAGELLAAALQRNERAVLVGRKTPGASISRELLKSDDGSSQLVVRGTFLQTPSKPISGVGVQPDVEVADGQTPDDVLQTAIAELRKSLSEDRQ